MKKNIIHGLSLLLMSILVLGSYSRSLAHGLPVITVNPTNVAAGEKITIVGSEMEAGEVFSITLEGMAGSIKLGESTAVKAQGAEDAGFEVAFTIPTDAGPGVYTVKASPEDGDVTTADLTITNPANKTIPETTTMQEPSSAPHVLDRSKPISEKLEIGIVILGSVLLGLVLIRSQT